MKTSVWLIAAAIVVSSLLTWAAGEAFHEPVHDLAATPADVTVIGENAGDTMGRGASGDFNGDGIDDLLLSAANSTVNGKAFAGRAHVVFGSPTPAGTIDLSTSADLTVLAADSFDNLGTRVAAGDFNADGIDDLLIGAPAADGPENARLNAGEAYVIFGSPGLGGTIDLFTTAPGLTVVGADASDDLGRTVGAGDVNGDGFDDLLLGAPEADATADAKSSAGEAYVIFGSPTLAGTIDLNATAPGLAVLGADSQDKLGDGTSGDFNDDGIDDLLLGAIGADAADNAKSNAGEAYVIFGSSGLGGTTDLATTSPGLSVLGIDANDILGDSVASGDFNGDGTKDLLIGATNTGAGDAYVVFGSPTLAGTRDLALAPADFTVIGATAGDSLSNGAWSGDFNGDGVDDLLLGANGGDGAGGKSDPGEVYVIFGSLTLSGTRNLATTPADRTVYGADSFDLLGVQVTSGDFNADGLADALMNAPLADGPPPDRADAGEAYVMFGACASGIDSDKDGVCDTFDPEDDGDGFTDEEEAGTPLCGNGVNDDSFDDGVVDDGCPGGPDQVGAFSEAQFNIGTGPLDPCGNDGWPADLDTTAPFSDNRVSLHDLTIFLAPTRRLDTSPGDASGNFLARFDLEPGPGPLATYINLLDLTHLIIFEPPMLGVRAFNGPSCPYPP